MTRTAFVYLAAAFFEIAGCFSIWLWLREGRTTWWVAPGTVSLLTFAWCLTLVDTNLAGRAYAAYGGVYIVSSLLWLWIVEGVRPDRWDTAGAIVCLASAGLILFGPRTVP